MNTKQLLSSPSASLLKQLLSMLYDSLLILSVLFISTAALLPFSKGEAISGPYYSFFLLMIIFCFYSWFWNKSGQTLGMKVWKIQIINENGYHPSWAVCFLRLFFSILSFCCLGIGYFWRFFKPFTWQDHFSQTRIIDISSLTQENSSKK